MSDLENISHVYKGLLLRNRAFASFRPDELNYINEDIKKYIHPGDWILDPMSGYGGGMLYFSGEGYKTYNIELNPPAYYWQILTNPQNRTIVTETITSIINRKNKLPRLIEKFSISDNLFTEIAINHIHKLYESIFEVVKNREISISLLLPFVARFANYQRSSTNITHFKEGGFCSFENWEIDFINYLEKLKNLLAELKFTEIEHSNILGNIFDINTNDKKFDFFITSPPYPNYRDYSKVFKIENWVLDNLFFPKNTNFSDMIGSNNVSGKKYNEVKSATANKFLADLLEKSKKLQKKPKRDIETYYHPYFALYFSQMQMAYNRLIEMLTENVVGYIVVNDNIIRDIPVPVGKTICDFFIDMGFQTDSIDETQIAHYGNIGKYAKRINSYHTRHILKVWKK
ncbi:MAG: hypothetical protein JNK09_09985 [Prolixibacteraceae bacterium]|nr:hypothetical protein [Prolixibacteraceae bacterium]